MDEIGIGQILTLNTEPLAEKGANASTTEIFLEILQKRNDHILDKREKKNSGPANWGLKYNHYISSSSFS